MTSKARRFAVVLLIVPLFLLSCGGPKPYRLIAEAAKSPERPAVFVHDKRLKLRLRKAMVVAMPDRALAVSPYVVGGHAYLVGWVEDVAQRTALEEAARTVSELRSVDSYMPVKPEGEDATSSSDEMELKAKVVGAILAAARSQKINVAVEILGSHAVLIGALGSAEQVQETSKAARDTSGVSGITNFLRVPVAADAKRFGGLLP